MKIKKYNNQRNVAANIIADARISKNMTRKQLSEKLELIGIDISGEELYRMENKLMLIKDFELIAIAKILNIDLNTLKDLIVL